MANIPQGSERKVRRGEKLRIQAKTWNDLVDSMRAYKRDKGNVGAGIPGFEVEPNSTVLGWNKTGSLIPAYRVLKINDVGYNPANNGRLFETRPILKGIIPASETDAIMITEGPISTDKIGGCVLAGLAVCKVQMISDSHDWANPVAGETYLRSGESGQARILWFGVITDFGHNSGGSGLSGTESGGDSGDGSGDENIYYAAVNLIGSTQSNLICADKNTLDYPFPNNEGYIGALPRYGQYPQQTGDYNDTLFWDYDSSGAVIHPDDMQQNGSQRTILNGRVGNSEDVLTEQQLRNKFFAQTVCIEAGSGLYDIRGSVKMLHRLLETGSPFNVSTYVRLVFLNADGSKISYTDGYGNTFGDYVYYDPPGSTEPLIVYRGLTDWVKVVSGRNDAGILTGDVWIQDKDFLGQTPPLIPNIGGWEGQCPTQERLLLAGDADVRIGWEIDIRCIMDDRVTFTPGSPHILFDALPRAWGYGGTYIIAKPVTKMDCDTCYRDESGESTPAPDESGETEDMCCTVELAAHPDLESDNGSVGLFSWSGIEWIATTVDSEKIALSCADGVWSAHKRGSPTPVTVGTSVTCTPFSVQIDTDAILDTGYGIITITIV